MTLILKTQYQSMTSTERNQFIYDKFVQSPQKPSPTMIRCSGTMPRLYFYSVDVFSYQTWLLILVVAFGVPLILGYYSKTGILH